MAGSGFGICFPETVAKVGCGVPTATEWWAGASLHPVWTSELKAGCKLKPPNQVRESLPNIRKTSGAICWKPQKMRELPITNLMVRKEKGQLFCFFFLLVYLTPSCTSSTGDIPASRRVWPWGASLLQDGSWLLPDVVGAAVCPFEATAADVLRAGQQPSGYAYRWECILIQMLKSLFELKSLA